MYEMTATETILLGIDLETPFPLGFGSLHHLPRVLYRISATDGDTASQGVGEASIDFPFVAYDAWDIYYVLSQLRLVGRPFDRAALLADESILSSVRLFPAALAAMNMALDDLHGRIYDVSVLDIYGQQRMGGKALRSIAHQQTASAFVTAMRETKTLGYIPKLKVGMGLETDADMLVSVDGLLAGDQDIRWSLDFNAQYKLDEFANLANMLATRGFNFNRVLLWEQPTSKAEDIKGLVSSLECLRQYDSNADVAADEVFLSSEDALQCAKHGVLLNYKVQRLGGIAVARQIEQVLEFHDYTTSGLVGGTFPTAIGRVYDQQCAAVLHSANRAGDGWEPSTDWFFGNKHLIREQFDFDRHTSQFRPFRGAGLGVNVDWDKIGSFTIADPNSEYLSVRQGKSGSRLSIQLKDRRSYQEEYEQLTGRSWYWNL